MISWKIDKRVGERSWDGGPVVKNLSFLFSRGGEGGR